MKENTKGQNKSSETAQPRKSGKLSNDNGNQEHQNASANRGGTTDMDSEALSGTSGNRSGSGVKTKPNITGSDYDGQVSPE